jgi:hypothetical protein
MMHERRTQKRMAKSHEFCFAQDTVNMEAQSSSPPAPVPSEEAVKTTMQHGLERIVVSTGAGLLIGGLMGVVLARGGGGGARKAFAGLGGGIGLGSAWTRTNMELEDLLQGASSK